jgi:hypothetical protein
VPVEAIQKFDKKITIGIITNMTNSSELSNKINYIPTYNRVEKILKLYSELLKSEKEKSKLLCRFLKQKK